jgi:hypothetical protein
VGVAVHQAWKDHAPGGIKDLFDIRCSPIRADPHHTVPVHHHRSITNLSEDALANRGIHRQ